MSAERGQATVELVGVLPLIAAIAFAAFTFLAAQAAGEHAAQAAEAGAVAMLQHHDARAAARAALPAGAVARSKIVIRGRHVTVRVRPRVPIPGLADRLAATVTADAGPQPAP